MLGSGISRAVGYFALWPIGFKPVDLLVGLVAVAAATWTSLGLVLLPRKFACAGPACRLQPALCVAVVAGVEVARQAFRPRCSMRPGLISCSSRYIFASALRSAFAAVTGLLLGHRGAGR